MDSSVAELVEEPEETVSEPALLCFPLVGARLLGGSLVATNEWSGVVDAVGLVCVLVFVGGCTMMFWGISAWED